MKIIIKKHFLENFDDQGSDAGNKIDASLTRDFTMSGNYPNETLNRILNKYFYRKVSLKIREIQF